MNLKNGMIAIFLLLAGITNAQVPNPPQRLVTPLPPVPVQKVEEVSIDEKNEIIDFPDVDAEFPGGAEAMKQYIQDNVMYPEVSVKNGDQGRVYITFVVECDGSVSGVDVMRDGVTQEINDEAKRLVREMPLWKPGEVKGEPVRCRCRLPITFTLNVDKEENVPEKKRLFKR